MTYVLSTGHRAGTKVVAHRVSRGRKHFGASVNRAGVEVRYAVNDIRAARSRSGLNRANGDAPGGTVPYKKADAERFAKLRTDFLAKHKAQNDYRISLAVKYGSFEQARSWASRGEKTRLEKLQAAEDKPRRKIYELIERINPQRGFGHGFPSQWIAEDLTWEDAVTLGPMSVVPPASYGYTVQEMQVKAGPVRGVIDESLNRTSGNMKVWYWFDASGGDPASARGESFSAIVKKGQAPRAAVVASIKRRLGTDVTLWPQSRTVSGEQFLAKWFDAKADVYRESTVEILPL